MHDCRKTKDELVDLLFNEAEAERELRLLEEVESCRVCREEHRLMQEALSSFDEAAYAIAPAGEFWTGYRARLDVRINEAASSGARLLPFWRRALRTSFSIPAPVAAAAAILLAATSILAVRSFMQTANPSAPVKTGAATAEVRIVEVPVEKRVVEERIVTRTVYVTKPSRAGSGKESAPSLQDLPGMTAKNTKDAAINPTRETLNGFQPPADVKITVIKGSFRDEK